VCISPKRVKPPLYSGRTGTSKKSVISHGLKTYSRTFFQTDYVLDLVRCLATVSIAAEDATVLPLKNGIR
ncbi:MAG: hypothetical protein V3T19_02065, partial [Acidiferrobacterales bacterium]